MEAIQAALERIALAFEDQNRINVGWIELQKAWHVEEEAINETRYQERTAIEREHLALRENDSDLYERWIITQEQAAQQVHMAMLTHLKEQPTSDTP
jgi:hypothetical protein